MNHPVRLRMLAERSSQPPAVSIPRRNPQKFNSQLLAGTGSALHYIFRSRYRTSGCGGCLEAKRDMDLAGPIACVERRTEFAERIHQNAKLKVWARLLDFVDHGLFGLTHYENLICEAADLHAYEVARKLMSSPKEG